MKNGKGGGKLAVELSYRETQVLMYMLTNEKVVTTTELAVTFDVSVRTIKYDLEKIRLWCQGNEIALLSQRNKGIWLDLQGKRRETIRDELLNIETLAIYPDQKDRIYRMIMCMCFATEFITAAFFSTELKVSKNTVMSDFDQLERFIVGYQVKLVRKNHYGFRIEGTEKNLRWLLESLLQMSFSDHEIYLIMDTLLTSKKQEISFSALLSYLPIKKLFNQTLNEAKKRMTSNFAEQYHYAEILTIILKVSIAASRMNCEKTMGRYKILSREIQDEQANELPFQLMKHVFLAHDLPLLEDEYIYIYSDLQVGETQTDIGELTKSLITEVSLKEQQHFEQDQQLFNNLFAHLSLKLGKKHLFINEYNPFVDDIKGKYATIFQHIYESCKNLIQTSFLVNDSFVAYITLHFLVSYQRLFQEKQKISVVYVCSTGLGVTSLIQQRIFEEIGEIETVNFSSMLKAEETIEKIQPDIVLSIFPLEIKNRPFIKVSPIPSRQDIQKIKELVAEQLSEINKKMLPEIVPKKRFNTKQNYLHESRELIIKAYIVYEEIRTKFATQLSDEYKEAFLLHVLLMVHRLHFNQPYEEEGNVARKQLENQVQLVTILTDILKKNNLESNKAEISALLQYMGEGVKT